MNIILPLPARAAKRIADHRIKSLLQDIVRNQPHVSCHNFHHGKKDQHRYSDICPCAAKWCALMKEAESIFEPKKGAKP